MFTQSGDTNSFNTGSFNANSHNNNQYIYNFSAFGALEDLPYAKGAGFDPAKACLEGTRTELIKSILDWVNDPKCTPMLWVHGVAGSGA